MPSLGPQTRRTKATRRWESLEDSDPSIEDEYNTIKSWHKSDSFYGGHTLRRTYFFYDNGINPTLTRHAGFSFGIKESYGLLPVTEVDFYFDRGFVEANSYNRFRPIKENLQTSDIVRTLETLAVSKETRFCRRNCVLETTFEIPIAGHYMPLTLDQLQEEGNGDDLIFSGKQDCIPNETKRPRRSFNSHNSDRQNEWRLHGGKSKKKSSLSSNAEGLIDKSRWLYYQGKYWDPSYLYLFRPTLDDHCETQLRSLGTLQKLCPLYHTEAFRARMQLGTVTVDTTTSSGGDIASQQKKTLTAAMVRKQYETFAQQATSASSNPDKVLQRLIVKTFTDDSVARGRYAHHYNQKKKSVHKHLEIDLGEICELTHIGFLGGYPSHLEIETFPPRKHWFSFQVNSSSYQQHLQDRIFASGKAYSGRRMRRMHRMRRKRQVQIVSEHALSWVKRFTVQYRDVVSRKWCDWPNELLGNTDIVHEVRHKMALQTRMLRIVPKEYHNHRDFTVMLYGHPMDDNMSRNQTMASTKKSWTKKEQKQMKRVRKGTLSDEFSSDAEDDDEYLMEDDVDETEDGVNASDEYADSDNSLHSGDKLTKKPLNLSMCYDLVHNQELTKQQNEQNMLTYRAVHNRYAFGRTRRGTSEVKKSLRNILGKKVETIRYVLQYQAAHAYNAEEILTSQEHFPQFPHEDMEKRFAPLTSCYVRKPEGHGAGLSYKRDYYGQPSEWKLRDTLRKNMMEDYYYSKCDENSFDKF